LISPQVLVWLTPVSLYIFEKRGKEKHLYLYKSKW
jgi:hypothetical protein